MAASVAAANCLRPRWIPLIPAGRTTRSSRHVPFFRDVLTSSTPRFAQRRPISSDQPSALPQLPGATGVPLIAFLLQRSHICHARSAQRRPISSDQDGASPLRCTPSQAGVGCGQQRGRPAGVGCGGLGGRPAGVGRGGPGHDKWGIHRGRGVTGHSVPRPCAQKPQTIWGDLAWFVRLPDATRVEASSDEKVGRTEVVGADEGSGRP